MHAPIFFGFLEHCGSLMATDDHADPSARYITLMKGSSIRFHEGIYRWGVLEGLAFSQLRICRLPSPPPPPRGPECASMNGFPMHVGRVRRVHNTQKKSFLHFSRNVKMKEFFIVYIYFLFLHFSRNVKMKEFSMWGERGCWGSEYAPNNGFVMHGVGC